MSDDDVGLVLMALILMYALLEGDPADALTMAFCPPAVGCEGISCAIRLYLLTEYAEDLR